MRIEPLEKNQVAESARPVYEKLEQQKGRVINFFKVMAHKPNILS